MTKDTTTGEFADVATAVHAELAIINSGPEHALQVGCLLRPVRKAKRANQEYGAWCDAQHFAVGSEQLRRYERLARHEKAVRAAFALASGNGAPKPTIETLIRTVAWELSPSDRKQVDILDIPEPAKVTALAEMERDHEHWQTKTHELRIAHDLPVRETTAAQKQRAAERNERTAATRARADMRMAQAAEQRLTTIISDSDHINKEVIDAFKRWIEIASNERGLGLFPPEACGMIVPLADTFANLLRTKIIKQHTEENS